MTIQSDDRVELFDRDFPALLDDVETSGIADSSEALVSTTGNECATASPAPNTLTEALAFARQHERMSVRALAEAASAVKVLQKVLGRPADHIPAAPQALTPLIESASPGRYRVKPKRWGNVVSLIRSLLRACAPAICMRRLCLGDGRHTPTGRRYFFPCRNKRRGCAC